MLQRIRVVVLAAVAAIPLMGWGLVGGAPLGADAAPPSCVTLPDAVPAGAGAREHNPRLCPPPPPPPPVTTYTLRTTDAQSTDPVWKTSYSANATYAIYFALDVIGTISGSHSYTLFEFAPNEVPYGFIQVTYTSTSCTPVFGGACSVDQISGGIRVWTSMPVAGTLIQQAQLYGTWHADAYVDGSATPNATTSFTIGP